ncbi:hypothetical protein Bhyg_09575 [Pseudolycoriella hygida]|uniref:Uncharacterized protein n=1 Tax=Pseudolycoriella hygida TaxID=35572 RepID=A0A9Q0N7V0_9DIPT|nr:hypothetical protein Bhyg_09575 [Pseudolycoriella hygida]
MFLNSSKSLIDILSLAKTRKVGH